MIIGMEWLEKFSPMKIHWAHKWLRIPYNSSFVTIQGLKLGSFDCVMVELLQLSSEEQVSKADTIPECIQVVLQEFQSVFATPTRLPPRRSCDHTIPLIEGAQPVQARPYRYALALKDKIEKQVKEMLQAGIIQPSTSAFSSLVLLVKKNDCNWRFYIDYRRLNALTIRGNFHLPVVDELSGASWFSKLDLRVGYHQICLAPREEYKTAFQIHSGHFEFKVMAFALCGAPNTFQGALNITLEPLIGHPSTSSLASVTTIISGPLAG
jgi:hypothetical protein